MKLAVNMSMMVGGLVIRLQGGGGIVQVRTRQVIFYDRMGRLPGEGWAGSPNLQVHL